MNVSNPGSTMDKKTVALSYHFFAEYVTNNVVEVRKIHARENFADQFAKPLVRNYFCGFYHE